MQHVYGNVYSDVSVYGNVYQWTFVISITDLPAHGWDGLNFNVVWHV